MLSPLRMRGCLAKVYMRRYMRMATKRNVNDWRRQQEKARTQTLGLTSAKHDMVGARLSSLIKVFANSIATSIIHIHPCMHPYLHLCLCVCWWD